jgi:hypothetical protein
MDRVLPLNKENGYLWLWSVVWDDVSIAIKFLSSNELLCVYLRQTSLAQERSALRNAFTHPPRWYWGSFQKPPHSIPLPPVPNFVHALKLKFHIMQKFSKLNNNKIWREHMAQTLILKHWTKFFHLFFPSFTKQVANFPTWIHLSMAGSHDLRSENCVKGALLRIKTHCFDQIMLAPL